MAQGPTGSRRLHSSRSASARCRMTGRRKPSSKSWQPARSLTGRRRATGEVSALSQRSEAQAVGPTFAGAQQDGSCQQLHETGRHRATAAASGLSLRTGGEGRGLAFPPSALAICEMYVALHLTSCVSCHHIWHACRSMGERERYLGISSSRIVRHACRIW